MSTKLNRDSILREMLGTLVKGWGPKAVYEALNDVVGSADGALDTRQAVKLPNDEPKAVQLVDSLEISGDKKGLIIQFARDFDAGTAFPKMSDVRAFLASHHRTAKELRTRSQAFRKMMPLLVEMSEKGLMKVISHSQYSGPTELGSISDAIRGAGETLRGPKSEDSTTPSGTIDRSQD